MKVFLSSDINYSYCHLFIQIFLLTFLFKNISTKCILEKQNVTCFGKTWKQDLLPIDNNSVEQLYISKCMESKSRSEVVDINFLRNMFKVTLLSMTNCEFTRPPLLDYPINSITVLDLSNNYIDTNAQFPVLGLDFFKQFPNLKVLNLSNNKLRHLPKSWFDCPSQLESIILDGNLIGGFTPSLADCFVKIKHLSLKGNKFEQLSAKKLSKGGRPKDAGGLKLLNNQNTLFRRSSKEDSHRREKLSRVRQENFGVIPQFQSLETLDLSHNNIQSIDQIPLSYLKNLYKINLSHNKLSSNTRSNLNDNKCDFGTAPFYINGKSGIIELDLSSNVGLSRIHNCWTFGLQNLRILRISNCSISTIYDSSFDKIKSLTMLDLSHNKLEVIPKEITVLAKSLTWLNLAYNNLNQTTSSYLSFLENLRTLDLSHNQYQNLISYFVVESDRKISDFIGDLPTNIRDSSTEDPINLLGQMRHLETIDLSYNELTKVSASSDLSPSIKLNGELQRINLRGNPLITQFIDFNANDITTTLTEFMINEDLKFDCDCAIVGFLKWITKRQIKISGKCATPKHLTDVSIINPNLVTSVLNDKLCHEITNTGSLKTTYRLKLTSNANLSLSSLETESYPMDYSQKRSANQKRQVDQQRWIMSGMNLTMRCEFYSTYSIPIQITIEWQRLQLKPYDSSHYSKEEKKINNFPLHKNDKVDRLDDGKYIEKIEHLSSNNDPRINIVQIGPLDQETVVDHLPVSEKSNNLFPKLKGPGYKYVGFLLLKPIYATDIGRYRCIANDLSTASFNGQNQLISKEENIKVFTPPRFTTTPSSHMAIIEGETAEITCRAIGYPPPLTSLGKIGSKDFPAARGRRMMMYKDDSSFFITNVRKVDAGNYSCTSRNAAGTIYHNFTLKVQMAAQILNKVSQKKNIRLGEPLILNFKVEGVPLPSVKWFKDDTRITSNDRVKFSSDQLMLIIQSAVLTDAGVYKFCVLNAFGGTDTSVSVGISNSQGEILKESPPMTKETSPPSNPEKDHIWMPDYWLSGIIIIVILSILITSILWITIFFCFSRIMSSKKQRLLLKNNLPSESFFNKKSSTNTTSFLNPRMVPSSLFQNTSPEFSIPLSPTTSTIVANDSNRDEYEDNVDIDTFIDNTQRSSTRSLLNSTPYSNRHFLSQPYLSPSRVDMSTKIVESTTSPGLHRLQNTDLCDSGIDSSQIYSETLNSSDAPPSTYNQCRHKSKHRKNYQKQRQRYMCSNYSDNSEAVKSNEIDVPKKNTEEDQKLQSEESSNDSSRSSHTARHCSTPLISVSVHNTS